MFESGESLRLLLGGINMRKQMMVLALLTLALTLGTMTASAQVAILAGSSSPVNFLNNADGTASIQLGGGCDGITTTTCTLSGTAFDFVGDTGGTYAFTTINDDFLPIDGGLLVDGLIPPSTSLHSVMPNGTATTFSMGFTDGDSLSATVHWISINDGSPQPRFNFTLTGITVSGDAAWTSLFASGNATGDFTLSPMTCSGVSGPCTLSDILASGSTGAFGGSNVSSGEILASPEPGSLLLFGTGLFAFGGFLRRRIRGA
jgi:hypothetical protein